VWLFVVAVEVDAIAEAADASRAGSKAKATETLSFEETLLSTPRSATAVDDEDVDDEEDTAVADCAAAVRGESMDEMYCTTGAV
jgi:hypothetical protein